MLAFFFGRCARNSICLIVFWGAFSLAWPVLAAEPPVFIGVTPLVVDIKAKARDILKQSFTIKNTDAFKHIVYPAVNNISAETGRQEFLEPGRADQSASLANWIAVTRGGIELLPGEKKTIEFSLEVNLRAAPGMYHAVISFADQPGAGGNDASLRRAPALAVNLEVIEEIKERLQLKKFIPDQLFFSAFPATFTTVILNNGNRRETPTGSIRIYNQNGREIASLPVNPGETEISIGSTASFPSVWDHGPRLGRFKALLNVSYGSVQPGTLQDTVFFWVVPWQKILAALAGLVLLLIIMRIWRRKSQSASPNF